jgi:hypothetical protein
MRVVSIGGIINKSPSATFLQRQGLACQLNQTISQIFPNSCLSQDVTVPWPT